VKCTLITACYNDAEFLGDCIDGILKQSSEDWEWIFVDDASQDGSAEKVEVIKDERVRVIRNKANLGVAASQKKALELATGEFCGIIDSDDKLHTEAVRIVSKCYKRIPKIGWLYSNHFWCDKNLKPGGVHKGKGISCPPMPGRSLVDMSLRRVHCFSHWRTFRTKVARSVDLYSGDLRWTEDKLMGYILEENAPGAFLDHRLYYYRSYKGNMTSEIPREMHKRWMNLAIERKKKRKAQGVKTFPIMRIK